MTISAPKKIITIQEDATVFLAFQKNREKFLVMLSAGVFDLQHGQVQINMHNGQIQTVHLHELTYKKTANIMEAPKGMIL